MRNAPKGSIQDAVRQSITRVGGLEAASHDLSLSPATLSRASGFDEDRPGGLGVNYLHQLGRIFPASAEPIACHFAELAGGVFQPVPADGKSFLCFSELLKEFSDVVARHAKAHSSESDNPEDFTGAEARDQMEEVRELVKAALEYNAILAKKVGPL